MQTLFVMSACVGDYMALKSFYISQTTVRESGKKESDFGYSYFWNSSRLSLQKWAEME
jgi:hypothetical protein